MKTITTIFASVALLIQLSAPAAFAQKAPDSSCCGPGATSGKTRASAQYRMTGRGSGTPNRAERRQHWIDEHKKVVAALKKMDAELQQKVDAMNQAQGPDKVNAMAAAINELVKQRETIDKHIEGLAERSIARMERRQEMMGQGGTGSSSEKESGSGHSHSGQESR